MKSEEEKRALFLPAELYELIEERVEATGFGSVDEYVIFVLEEVLKEEGEEGEEKEAAFSKEEEEEVKKRLKALGYMD